MKAKKIVHLVELAVMEAFLLVEGFGQTISDVERSIRDIDNVVTSGSVSLLSTVQNNLAVAWDSFVYSRQEGITFHDRAKQSIKELLLDPSLPDSNYWLYGEAQYGEAMTVYQFTSQPFRLIRNGSDVSLPPEAFELTFEYRGTRLVSAPSVTDYVVRAWPKGNAQPLMFSTAGDGRNDFSTVAGSTCALSTAQDRLRTKKVVSVDLIWVTPNDERWDKVEFVLYEGEKATTVALEKPEPKLLLFSRGGTLHLHVIGGTADIDIEEAIDLNGPWTSSRSLSRPLQPLSEAPGTFISTVTPDGKMKFFRPRQKYRPPLQ